MKTIRITLMLVLVLSVALLSLTSCDVVQGIIGKLPGAGNQNEHVHAFVDATCTTPATCECGATQGEALGHSFAEGKCSVCGAEDPDYVAPHVHSYESVVTAPTCTEAGYTTYTCSCGDTYTADEVVATGHSYESVVTAPTCTADGYTTYTCACGHSTVVTDTPALGHSYNPVVTAPICEAAGYTTYTCSVCSDSYTADEVAALGHTFVDSKCTKCEAAYVAPATGDWALVTELKTGDHVLIGNPAYGKLLSADKVSAGSYYNKGVVYAIDNFANVTDAEIWVVTVNDDGTYSFVSLTGEKLGMASSYASLNSEGPNFSWSLTANDDTTFLIKNTVRGNYLEWYASMGNWSTYTAGNTTEYYLSFYAKGEAEGEHVHNHISKVVAPTCTDAGYTSYTCSCGDTYSVAGDAATGHSHATSVVAPTCTDAGYTLHLCECGDSYTTDEVAALGHNFVDGVCTVCEAADPDYVVPSPVVGGGSVDFNTIVTSNANGDSSYTKTFTTANGWTVNYSAIQAGGSTVMNPQFPVIGPDNTYRAVCLNGKTSAPGSLTSPTLNGGISKLTINYTKMFTDTLLSVTVTITDANGNSQSQVISVELPKDEKYVVYTYEWILETPVTGDFTIEVVNNCPSGNDGNKDRFTILDLSWEGAAEVHTHSYENVVTLAPTCTAVGSAIPTCSCGDVLDAVELPVADHIDTNLDITCDFDGCTKRIIPVADTKVSLFTANHMIIVSLSGNYYVEGTVIEVIDAKNGNFIITDAEGYTFFIRMPVDANGVTHANWQSKVAVGDVVSVYGQPKTTSGWNTTEKAGMQGGVLTFIERHPHDFTFSPADCSDPAYCACGQPYGEPLGCADTDGDDLCDDCGKNVKYVFEYVEIRTDNGSGVHDATALTYTWTNGNFDVQVAKATGGNLYVSSNNHMRLYKGNTLTLTNNNGLAVKVVIVHLTNATQVTNFEKFLTGYNYTVDAEKFTISIEVDTTETIVFTNPSNGSTTQVKGIEFGYEK